MSPSSPKSWRQQSGGVQAKATTQEPGSLTGQFHRGICQVALVSGGSPAQVTSPPNFPPSAKTAPALLVGKGKQEPTEWEVLPSQDRLAAPMEGVRSQTKPFHKGFSQVRPECRAWGFSATLDLNQKGFPQGAYALEARQRRHCAWEQGRRVGTLQSSSDHLVSLARLDPRQRSGFLNGSLYWHVS